MIQSAMREELSAYLKQNPSTENAVILKCLIAGTGDLFARGQSLAHVTASAWILNQEGTHALLIEHAKYHKFCPPGGHVDPDESALQACLREIGEEVGLHNLLVLSDGIFDIDIHRIPASEKKNEPAHWHIDVRYALQASANEEVSLNLDECLSYKWQSIHELAKLEDRSIARLALKTRRTQWPVDFVGLGFEPAQIDYITQALKQPGGLVIVSGISGSGVELTQQALMNHLIEKQMAEKPVNAASSEASVCPVSAFEAALRSAKNSTPAFVLHSNMRDEVSVESVRNSVKSGQKVISRVHSASAIDSVMRLRTQGISPKDLGNKDFLSLLIHQHRIPLVCPHCSMGFEQFKALGEDKHGVVDQIHRYVQPEAIEGLRFRNAEGCPSCLEGATGFTLAAEVIEPDDFMRQCFAENRDPLAFFHYRLKGGYVVLEHALSKVFRGEVDIRDVEARVDQMVALQELEDACRAASGLPQQAIALLGKGIFEDKTKAGKPSLAELGYTSEQIKVVRATKENASGHVIVAGQTYGALSSTLSSLAQATKQVDE